MQNAASVEPPIYGVTEQLVELIRKEAPELLRSGRNWKLSFSGSAAGDVHWSIEMHSQVKGIKPVRSPR